ncbi:MAG TPA: carboxypeptidase-like regulatory domain-containing protein, partial [Planctomycetota bacterium]|nr:carboxypeptidase-like regulatory domain-containing protein [Planctomycetota bacterium]
RYELDCALGQWGQEQVIVRCAGYQPASVRLPVALGVTEKDFVLQPAATLHGRVVFADGRPVAGAAVHTLSDGYFGDGAAATTTAADGRFTLDGLAPGEATVCAEAAGFAATTQSGEAARDVGSPELVLVLTPGMTASGDVVDERGAPVAGTSVRAGSKDQQTDARGRFVLAGLALDVSHVDIVGANHVRLENAPLQSGSANHFVVQRAGALVGCVVDRATGIPLEDFTVRIVSGPGGIGADWAREGRHFQNTHGLWRTEREPMSPGDAYMLRVMAPGHASRVGSVVASLDPEPRSTIGLDQGVLVRGMLLDSLDNSPIANAEVQLLELPPETRSFESKPRKVTASATGRFTLPAVSADQIWLQVAAPARLTTVAGPFTLPAVGEADLLVRVGAGAVILGVLRDDSGAPLADVELQAQNLAQGNERLLHCKARTDDHGRFRIAGLPAGKAYLSTTVLRGNDLLVFARRFELQEGNNPFDLTPRGTGTLELEVGGDTQKGSLRIDMIEPNADQDGPLFVVLPRSERITLRGLPAGAYKVWYTEFSGRREDRPVAREVRVVVGATEPAHARLDCSR